MAARDQRSLLATGKIGAPVPSVGDNRPVDGDIFARCLPILRESGARVLSGKQTAQENELLQEVFQADSVLTF